MRIWRTDTLNRPRHRRFTDSSWLTSRPGRLASCRSCIQGSGQSSAASPARPWTVEISGDSHWVGFTGRAGTARRPRGALIQRTTGLTVVVGPAPGPTYFHDVSDDARFVLIAGEHSTVNGQRLRVVDRLSGLVSKVLDPLDTPLGRYRLLSAQPSGDGNTIVATLGDGATADPTPRRTFIARLDADGDGMHDSWEVDVRPRPVQSAGRVRGSRRRRGVERTRVHLRHSPEGQPRPLFRRRCRRRVLRDTVSPSTIRWTTTVTANLMNLGPDGAVAATPVTVPAEGPAFIEVSRLGLPFSEFAMVVESPVLLAAERRMTWDRTGQYGSHADSGCRSAVHHVAFFRGRNDCRASRPSEKGSIRVTRPLHVTMRYLRRPRHASRSNPMWFRLDRDSRYGRIRRARPWTPRSLRPS